MGRRTVKKMKWVKWTALLIAVAAEMVFLGGCKNYAQIEDRNYVMCMGIDEAEGGLYVSYGFPDLKALTGSGDNIHYPSVTLFGENLEAVEAAFAAGSSRRLDYGQLQMIVFGRDLMSQPGKMKEILEYIRQHQEFTRTVLVCMADGAARDIVALDDIVNGSIGIYLRQMFENNFSGNCLTIGDLVIGLSLEEEYQEITVVSPESLGPRITGSEKIRGYVRLLCEK